MLALHGRGVDELWLIELFNVDRERSVPTLYSFSALQFCAFLLGIITAIKMKIAEPYVLHWAVLGFTFVFLSLDEALAIHEQLITPTVSWTFPYMILTSIFALSFLRFLSHLPPRTRRLFILSGLMYVGGAVGLEIPGGQYIHAKGADWVYQTLVTIEEFMEMMGIVLFIYALSSYISLHLPPISLVTSDEIPDSEFHIISRS